MMENLESTPMLMDLQPLEATANCELSSLHYLEGIDVPTA